MKLPELEKVVIDHIAQDKAFHEKMDRVLFGSEEEKEIGIVEMIKTMYSFFTTTSNIKTILISMGVIGGIIVTIKGWWVTLLAYFLK